MKSPIAFLLLTFLTGLVSADDLMAVCYSFTEHDACSTAGPRAPVNRRMLAKQGAHPHPTKRRLAECGQYCHGWSTFCAEYLCDADTLGMTCDDVMEQAQVHMKEFAEAVGTDECMAQMQGLQCMCVDQDGV